MKPASVLRQNLCHVRWSASNRVGQGTWRDRLTRLVASRPSRCGMAISMTTTWGWRDSARATIFLATFRIQGINDQRVQLLYFTIEFRLLVEHATPCLYQESMKAQIILTISTLNRIHSSGVIELIVCPIVRAGSTIILASEYIISVRIGGICTPDVP